MHRIGVISDTHISGQAQALVANLRNHFAGVELILHAGDLSTLRVIAELEEIAPVEAVQGNIEHEEVIRALPIKRRVRIRNSLIGLVHILGEHGRMWDPHNKAWGTQIAEEARREFPDAQCVVFGHTHHPYNEWIGGQLLFNPGSATGRWPATAATIGLLEIGDDGTISGHIIPISQ
jgi:putative phosphoesterase